MQRAIRYTTNFEWVMQQTELYQLGLTEQLWQLLKEVIHLELPKPGQKLRKDEVCGFVEARKAVIDLFAPMDGTVIQVNPVLLLNQSEMQDIPPANWLYAFTADSHEQWQQLQEVPVRLECANDEQ